MLERRAKLGWISGASQTNVHLDLNCPGLVWSRGTQRGLLILQKAELRAMGESDLVSALNVLFLIFSVNDVLQVC